MTRTCKFGLAACAAWLAAIGIGWWAQASYEQRPGVVLDAPRTWPTDSAVAHHDGRTTVVMALHPRCPCSRATLTELAEFAPRRSGSTDITVLVCAPADAGPDWTDAGTCRTAREIPGVSVVVDPSGRSAARLGMRTSGHVVVYAPDGHLRFSGGITGGRGQIGPNPGLDALIALAGDRHPASAASIPTSTPVFGCELVAPDSCPACQASEQP